MPAKKDAEGTCGVGRCASSLQGKGGKGTAQQHEADVSKYKKEGVPASDPGGSGALPSGLKQQHDFLMEGDVG
jgi:hypothetical protein